MLNAAPGTSRAMRELLKSRNKSLARDFEALALALDGAAGPQLLLPYKKRLKEECRHWRNVIARNFRRLRLPQDDILEDVLSDTQQATIYRRLISERMAAPVLRTTTPSASDSSYGCTAPILTPGSYRPPSPRGAWPFTPSL